MKKILTVLMLLYGQLHALERESTLKIYHQIFSVLVPKPVIRVFTDDREYRQVFAYSKRIFLSRDPEKADVILVTNRSTLSKIRGERENMRNKEREPVLFVTDYRLLKLSPEAVGAFYWRKGRSQLLFIKNRLDKHNITLPKEYKNFLVDAL
ncbi:hypothetical protein ACM66Z_07755 [Sulfurovum sp. ST-21]|uniref:Uncharacterized protein n=1 Tax=Sulfurovum indicum TaxID=2779528 RepID=A0A7M1S4Q4_9BACT|nr:hypothetical protein [Sulfurovum indicum]QOR61340.1 hypothetical protein IMZ28_07750 [Sulfurovum indicum]